MRQTCLPVLTSLAVTNPRTPNSPPLMPVSTLSLMTSGAIVIAQHAGRERPGDLEVFDGVGIDRVEGAVAGRRIVLVRHRPLLVFLFHGAPAPGGRGPA